MLGEEIGGEEAKTVGQRVIESEGAVKVETSALGTGKILGVQCQSRVTYVSEMRPDGTLFGNVVGVVMGEDGSHATFKGNGVGVFQEKGAIAYRGAIYYTTNAPTWEQLNKCATLFEYNVDADGGAVGKLFEWK